MVLPVYTYEEVSKHNKATDCWLVIDDHVYDVTKFVPRHPGGNMIYLNAGRESTKLFESYHPDSVKPILSKFLIGRVEGPNLFRVQFANEQEDKGLYEKIKTDVMAHLKSKKIDPRFSWQMYIKSFVIFFGCFLAFYLTHFYLENFVATVIAAVVLGFLAAEVGVCIQHDANHGGFSSSAVVNKWVGTSLDFVGASSFIWKQQHVFGHHVYTNIEGIDPDIRVHDPDIRRTNMFQPWREYQAYQHVYLGLLYSLLSIKSIFIDDFKMLFSGWIGVVPVNHIHMEELIVFFGGKAFYFLYYIVLPLIFSQHSLVHTVQLWLIAHLVTGWTLAFMFQVNHVTDRADFYEKKGDKVNVGWTKSQIEGTSDFAHDSWFWTHVSGGLNYQVVHHLFPWVCHVHYPEIAPIVKKACKEAGINYIVYPTFMSALAGHFNHMKAVGKAQ